MLGNQALAYSNKLKVLGGIAEISFLHETVTIVDEDTNLHTTDLHEVTFLEQVGELKGQVVYDADVVQTIDKKLFEVELLHEEGEVVLHLLDKKFDRVEAGEKLPLDKFSELEPYVTLIDNVFVLRNSVPVVDFNIKVVREVEDGEVTYFYACNNKDNEEVDLIKVIYMGHQLLEEEEYERRTLSYEVYLDSVESKTIVEVKPNELWNYVTGVASMKTNELDNKRPVVIFEDEVKKEKSVGEQLDELLGADDEDEEEYDGFCDCEHCRNQCDECYEKLENCECDEDEDSLFD